LCSRMPQTPREGKGAGSPPSTKKTAKGLNLSDVKTGKSSPSSQRKSARKKSSSRNSHRDSAKPPSASPPKPQATALPVVNESEPLNIGAPASEEVVVAQTVEPSTSAPKEVVVAQTAEPPSTSSAAATVASTTVEPNVAASPPLPTAVPVQTLAPLPLERVVSLKLTAPPEPMSGPEASKYVSLSLSVPEQPTPAASPPLPTAVPVQTLAPLPLERVVSLKLTALPEPMSGPEASKYVSLSLSVPDQPTPAAAMPSETEAKAALQHPWLQDFQTLRQHVEVTYGADVEAAKAELLAPAEGWASEQAAVETLKHPWLRQLEWLRAEVAEGQATDEAAAELAIRHPWVQEIELLLAELSTLAGAEAEAATPELLATAQGWASEHEAGETERKSVE